ncbi:uncharacterized protein LOC142775787 isoform X2 [Rhipicephalus microplus]|uniref:uncharacterized protein LOC142775787 isoform X2 n=1 Tax=Rhipicephalus microplus TaxID=6941 RepID=UPI003F6C1412
MEIERMIKEFKSFSNNLCQKLGILAENEMPHDGPTKKLYLTHNSQAVKAKEATMAVDEAEEWLQRLGILGRPGHKMRAPRRS